MMQVCGYNKYFQLAKTSNSKNFLNFPTVFPPIKSSLNVSSLLSYSVSLKCSIWVTSSGRAFAVGDNQNYQIIGSLPKKVLDTEMEIIITDKEGLPYTFLSAICGESSSLYLVLPPDGSDIPQVAYVHIKFNSGVPVFLNLGDRKPVSLYGYNENSAIIDSEGSIFLITDSVIKSPNSKLQPLTLPNNEKAIYVSCLKKFIIALSSNGHLYEAPFSPENKNVTFSEVQELKGQKIDQISGYSRHCFAVNSKGQVFGKGSNESGELGLGSKIKNVDKFTEITSLKKFKISAAYAGNDYSLYRTADGKIFGSGSNFCGELFLGQNPGEYSIYSPVETVVKRGATFCITNSWISAVFIGCDPPPRCPNLPVFNVDVSLQIKNENAELKSLLRVKEIEFFDLKNQHEILLEKIKSFEGQKNDQKLKEIDELKKKEGNYLLQIKSINDENEKKENEINKLKQSNQLNLKEIDSLREQIKKFKKIDELEKNKSDEIESLKKQLVNQKDENDKKAKEIDDLNKQNKIYLKEIETLKNQKSSEKNEKKSEFQVYQDKIDSIKKTILNQNKEITNKENQIKDLKEQNEKYNQHIEDLKKQLQCKMKENEELKKIYESNSNKKKMSEIEKFQKKEIGYITEIQSLKNQIRSMTESQTALTKKEIVIFDSETINNLKKLNSVGRGATSEVFKVSKDEIFALKVLYKSEQVLEEGQDEINTNYVELDKMKKLLNEYELLYSINHPNIVKVFGFSFGDEENLPSILFEYCPFTLKNCIKILKDDERVKVLIQIADAMKYVHSLGIIHCDLKLENILLDDNKNVKISDFGMATQINSDSVSLKNFGGTFRFIAPEILTENPDYDQKVDVYSFGVVFFLILSKGEFPKITLVDIISGKKATIPDSFSRFSGELINRCWSYDPNERPSFAEILDSFKQNQHNII